ncbi:MAG: 2-oxoacid:acceptor oxidoreductase family protein, partial [Atribacterota bacterium]|nr:2-oxoacid:acceptor oxidoreductase family protein [Atribacterota bacterium]
MKQAKRKSNSAERDISIVLCGGAGLGIQTVEQLLTRMLKMSGYYVFATKEYMSRVRGGSNSTQIRV